MKLCLFARGSPTRGAVERSETERLDNRKPALFHTFSTQKGRRPFPDSALCAPFLFMILHPRVDGAGAVDLFREDEAGQLMGHRDAAHAELERRRTLDLLREAVGRADDESHIPRPAVCTVGEELRSSSEEICFPSMHMATMAAPLRALARMALPSLSSAFFTTASEAFFSSIFSSGSSTMRKDANAARRFWYSATPSAKYFALSLPTQIKSMSVSYTHLTLPTILLV